MSRVLFVVAAFLCIALSCAAQENELRCGGRRCAVTLDAAATEDQKKKIEEVRNLLSSAKTEAGKSNNNLKPIPSYCNQSKSLLGDVTIVMTSIVSFMSETKKYLQTFTGLGVEEDLVKLQKAAVEADEMRNTAAQRAEDICDTSEHFSKKSSSIEQGLQKGEEALKTLETTYSDTALEEVKKTAETLKAEAEQLVKEAKTTIKTVIEEFVKTSEIDDTATKLKTEIAPVFENVKKAYDKCEEEVKSKLNGGNTNEEKIRRQVCQKKKEDPNSSKKSEAEESNNSKKSDEKKDPNNSKKSDSEESNNSQPTTTTTTTTVEPKRDRQNDGAARYAVLRNVFFVCLFVVGVSVLAPA